MKYLYSALAWLCLLCMPPTRVCADVVNGIDILSSVYSLYAPWSYTWSGPGGVNYSGSGNYGGSSSDGSVVSGALRSAGPFPPGLSAGVSGSADIGDRSIFGSNFTFDQHTSTLRHTSYYGSDGNLYALNSEVYAQAQASWTFRPTAETIQIELWIWDTGRYYGSSGLSVTLSDVTQSSVVLAFSESDTWGKNMNVTNVLSVSTSDTYELTVHGRADTYDDDATNQDVSASIQIVPEPSVFGLSLLGLLSLAGCKRWPVGNPRS